MPGPTRASQKQQGRNYPQHSPRISPHLGNLDRFDLEFFSFRQHERTASLTEFSAEVTDSSLPWQIPPLLSPKAMLGQFTEQTAPSTEQSIVDANTRARDDAERGAGQNPTAVFTPRG